jgi:hypothetical protein
MKLRNSLSYRRRKYSLFKERSEEYELFYLVKCALESPFALHAIILFLSTMLKAISSYGAPIIN